MKTFLLSKVKRLKNYSQELDAKAVLHNKSWEVFNETGDKELMIFRSSQELVISRNGIVQKGKWELLDIANILIDVGEVSYLLNASYIEDEFLALKLDGTERYMVMIEADMKNRFSLNSIKSIEGYLDNRYRSLEAEKEAKNQEQKRLEERREEEKERTREQERKRLILEQEERERQNRQKREQKEREDREQRAQEEREKRIAEAEVLENERKEEFIHEFRRNSPKEYKEVINCKKREVVKKELEDNRAWVHEENYRLIVVHWWTIAFLAVAVALVIPPDSEIMNIIGYIIGIPGVIIALIFNYRAETELINYDVKPKNKIITIIVHAIVLLLSLYAAYSVYINYGYGYYSLNSQKFVIYTLVCIAIKTIISIISNISTIRHYYSLFSTENDLLDTNDIYDAITNYNNQ